jgi:hypothetical protein
MKQAHLIKPADADFRDCSALGLAGTEQDGLRSVDLHELERVVCVTGKVSRVAQVDESDEKVDVALLGLHRHGASLLARTLGSFWHGGQLGEHREPSSVRDRRPIRSGDVELGAEVDRELLGPL